MSEPQGGNPQGGYNPQSGGPGGSQPQYGYGQPQYGGYGAGPGGSASFDMRKVIPGGLVAIVGGVLLFIFSFFPWYGACAQYIDVCIYFSAWDYGVALFSVILLVIASVASLLRAVPAIPASLPLELIALGAVALGDILFLISLATTPLGAPRAWALWVALVLCLAINAGVILQFLRAGGFAMAQRSLGGGRDAAPPPGYGQQGYPPQQPPQQPPGTPPQPPGH